VKAPREAAFPHRFGRSRAGVPFEVTRTGERDAAGRKLYRLRFLEHGLRSPQRWTAAELHATGAHWHRGRPWAVQMIVGAAS
jgi:hypothetical protein